jgi:crossover junction endodeoxyribonuclease RuvC
VIVLGIDPGTRTTGYGVVAERGNAVLLVECGVIRTDENDALAHRLRDIHQGVLEVLGRHAVAVVAVEKVFHGRNAKTSLMLGHARGAVLLAATLRDLPVAEYTPAEIKLAVTGTGRATKEQIQYMVQRLLQLRTPPQPDDAADGIAVALCHCSTSSLQRRLEGRLS